MAADEDEMTWMIYYRQIMGVLETNTELRRAFQSNLHNDVVKMDLYVVVVCVFQCSQGLCLQE